MAAASYDVSYEAGSSSMEMMICLSFILNTFGREEEMMRVERQVVRRRARIEKNMRFFLIFKIIEYLHFEKLKLQKILGPISIQKTIY
jgi:hypothetical protein